MAVVPLCIEEFSVYLLKKHETDDILKIISSYSGVFIIEIAYNKLFKLLVDKQISPAELRKATGLSSCTFTKLRRNEPVTTSVLLKIGEYLNCDIGDMCEFVYSPESSTKTKTR